MNAIIRNIGFNILLDKFYYAFYLMFSISKKLKLNESQIRTSLSLSLSLPNKSFKKYCNLDIINNGLGYLKNLNRLFVNKANEVPSYLFLYN